MASCSKWRKIREMTRSRRAERRSRTPENADSRESAGWRRLIATQRFLAEAYLIYWEERNTMDLRANVRKLTMGALAISSWLLASGAVPCAAQDSKPNIVMLMTDDTGWGDFGAYGGGREPRPSHPERRSRRQGGRGLHQLVRPGELHRRPRLVHDGTHPDPLGSIGRGGSG